MEFAITEAKDWNMLITLGSVSWIMINVVIFGLLGVIWRSVPKGEDLMRLRESVNLDVEKLAGRFEAALEKHSERHTSRIDKDTETLWSEMRRCQETHTRMMTDCQRDCCPRGKMTREPGA